MHQESPAISRAKFWCRILEFRTVEDLRSKILHNGVTAALEGIRRIGAIFQGIDGARETNHVVPRSWASIIGHKSLGEKPSNVAIIALCPSIGTAAFSIYQWWSGQRASRIAAAVDISNKYIDNRIAPYELTTRIIEQFKQGKSVSDDDKRRFDVYSNHLEYIAYLINRDQIDFDFIPELLRCDIIVTSEIINLLREQKIAWIFARPPNYFPPSFEMEAFRGRLSREHWSCDLQAAPPHDGG